MSHARGMNNGCSETVRVSVADAYRTFALAVFGTGSMDKMHLAKMSVLTSIADILTQRRKQRRTSGR